MSQPAPASANTASLILLRLGLIITGLFTSLFLLLTQLQGLPFGKALLYIVAGTGLALLFHGLRDLFRELNRQAPPQTLPPATGSR